ncbi:hypothetical protein D0T56_00965 [Dysgonomonas sp. 520]|nr:hypothetical protein [Dysgonomonas sp. 520]
MLIFVIESIDFFYDIKIYTYILFEKALAFILAFRNFDNFKSTTRVNKPMLTLIFIIGVGFTYLLYKVVEDLEKQI